MTEKYCYTVGEEGQESLDLLEKGFNEQTQYFLQKHGLKPGMKVLDIGCGLGFMTQIIAERVGDSGKVVAIDNSDNQIKAASKRTPEKLKHIIDYYVHDLYELEALDQTFDMVYCRFVLHHVHKPRQALDQIAKVLKPGGWYIGIEGIINYAYSYPPHPAWQEPNFPCEVAEGKDRNGNLGKILPRLIKEVGLTCIEASIFQPMLIKDEVRQLLLKNECVDNKVHDISNGVMTEDAWQAKYQALKSCVDDKETLIAFYAGNFTASRK
jgi:ubiquinone/menaquinone biosynthesis C-methylase UbiE